MSPLTPLITAQSLPPFEHASPSLKHIIKTTDKELVKQSITTKNNDIAPPLEKILQTTTTPPGEALGNITQENLGSIDNTIKETNKKLTEEVNTLNRTLNETKHYINRAITTLCTASAITGMAIAVLACATYLKDSQTRAYYTQAQARQIYLP